MQNFKAFFVLSPICGKESARLTPPADPMKVAHRISLKNKMSLKKRKKSYLASLS